MIAKTGLVKCMLVLLLAGSGASLPGEGPPARAAGGDSAGPPPPALFREVVIQYERVRLALVADDLAGIREPARRLAGVVGAWARKHTGASGGAPERMKAIERAAGGLVKARTLGDARESFWRLSMRLIEWKKQLGLGEPAIAFCPMIRRKWLQPLGSIGNPFAGGHMVGCGEFVDE